MISKELIFVLYGFFKAFKPSEAFLTPYLIQDKHFSRQEVNNQVYPIWTYSFFLWIIPITFIAEKFGYRTAIFLESLGHLSTRILLIFGRSLFVIQVSEVCFALAIAGELVYYSYVFKVFIDPRKSEKMTSLTHSAVLLGHCTASCMGQIMVFQGVEFEVLFWISLISVCIACLIFPLFPAESEYAKLDSDEQSDIAAIWQEPKSDLEGFDSENSDNSSFDDSDEVYEHRNSKNCRFSMWNFNLAGLAIPLTLYSLHKAHLYNIEEYGSVLWYKLLQDQNGEKESWKLLNGFADAGSRGLAAIFAYLAWKITANVESRDLFPSWSSRKLHALLIFAFLLASSLITFGETFVTNIYFSYLFYILIVGLSGALTSWTLVYCASRLSALETYYNKRSFALLFGFGTLLSSGMRAAMQYIMVLFNTDIFTKFVVFSCFSCIIVFIALVEFLKKS